MQSTSNPVDVSQVDPIIVDEVRQAQEYLRSVLRGEMTSSTEAFSEIPVVDLEKSFSTSLVAREAVAKEIHAACTTTGFFYIKNHRVSQQLCADTLKLAERFFKELPLEKKEEMHIRYSGLFRGWRPSESGAASSIEENIARAELPENKEAFNWAYQEELDPTGGDGKYLELDGTRKEGNVWPKEEDLPGFFEGIRAYYGQILQLSRHLLRLFALALSLPEDYFDSIATHPGGVARLLFYPAQSNVQLLQGCKAVDNTIGIRPHSDFECFTILLQSKSPGLEILSPNGQWVDAEPLDGAFVVNIGDFLMRVTNSVYKSTVHRVVNRSTKERYSIPFFFSVNYEATVETLPSCISENNPIKYTPINAGKYILERLKLAVQDNE